jgi:mannose 2-epimerase
MKILSSFVIFLCLSFTYVYAQQAGKSQELKDDYIRLHNHLYNELIPFWNKNAEDKQYGGFQTNFDDNGKPLEMPEKYLNTQCRMIWWFSRLNEIIPGEDNKNKAKEGVDFLIKYLWDYENEGWGVETLARP